MDEVNMGSTPFNLKYPIAIRITPKANSFIKANQLK